MLTKTDFNKIENKRVILQNVITIYINHTIINKYILKYKFVSMMANWIFSSQSLVSRDHSESFYYDDYVLKKHFILW